MSGLLYLASCFMVHQLHSSNKHKYFVHGIKCTQNLLFHLDRLSTENRILLNLNLGKYVNVIIQINATGYICFLIAFFLHCGLVANLINHYNHHILISMQLANYLEYNYLH